MSTELGIGLNLAHIYLLGIEFGCKATGALDWQILEGGGWRAILAGQRVRIVVQECITGLTHLGAVSEKHAKFRQAIDCRNH